MTPGEINGDNGHNCSLKDALTCNPLRSIVLDVGTGTGQSLDEFSDKCLVHTSGTRRQEV